LFEHHLYFFLEFVHLLAFGFEDGVLLFEHDEVGAQELFDAVGVLVEFAGDVLAAGAGAVGGAVGLGGAVGGSVAHLTDLNYYITLF
jgi:hypothetical protein